MNTNLIVQPIIALYTQDILASKSEEFQKLYTNNNNNLSIIQEKLLEKENAKEEIELLEKVADVLADMKLKINFDKLESDIISNKHQRIAEIQVELASIEIDISKDSPSILKDLQKNEININYLSKNELEKYKNSMEADLLLEWLKIKSEIQQFESLKSSQIDGFIKPKFHLWGSLSGRVISHSPSTQNFPKYYKDFIMPLNDDEAIYELDIKSAEVLGLANIADEHKIFDLLCNGKDIYIFVFSQIFNKSEDEITEENRKLSKKIVNGINLGLGVEGLKNIINDSKIAKRKISEKEAEVVRDKYFNLFPKIKESLTNIAKAEKLTTNLEFEMNVEPSYKNMSFPAQNLVATIIKIVMTSLGKYKGKIVNIVHDSLWFSCSKEELAIIKNYMEDICKNLLPEEYLDKEIELVKVTKLGGK